MVLVLIIIFVLIIFRYASFALLQGNLAPEINYTEFTDAQIQQINYGTDFFYGTASAAYQVEKSVNESNWSKFEKEGKTPAHLNADEALEHFDEDLEIMTNAYMKVYRFGISWTDIEPARDNFNETHLQIYVNICDKLRANGIEPLITLNHFEYPVWVDEEGGYLSPNLQTDFENFIRHVLTELKGHCRYFITVNEPLSYAMLGYLGGTFPPGKTLHIRDFFKVSAAIMTMHANGYRIIHEIIPDAQVSMTNQIIPLIAKHKWSLIETFIASVGNGFINRPYMDCLITGVLEFKICGLKLFSQEIEGLKDSVDFLGMNHYTCIFATIDPRDWNEFPFANRRPNKNIPLSDFNWSCIPGSLSMVIKWTDQIWNPRHLPILITEHGVSDYQDKIREWFVTQSIAHLQEVFDMNISLKGYIHWSIMDNYEWHDGYTQHFGFVKVDLQTQVRTPQKSFDSYIDIAKKAYEQESSKYEIHKFYI